MKDWTGGRNHNYQDFNDIIPAISRLSIAIFENKA
jgi:hypothetical protein